MAVRKNKKKKKDIATDEYGDKDVPFTTNERALRDYGIEVIQGSSEKKRKRKQRVAVGIVGIFIAVYGISVVSSLTANGRINNLSEVVESQESPAFKSRYDSLGKSIIEDYYSQKQTPVNLLTTAAWSTDDEQGGSAVNSSSDSSSDSDKSIPVDVESLSLINAYEEEPQMGELEDEVKEVMTNPKLEILTYSGTIDGKQYKFGITLLAPDISDPTKLPYLVYAPTMMPMDDLLRVEAEASTPQAGDSGKYTEFTLSDDAVDTIDDWASAYAQNDGEILKRITGDNDPRRSYKGIGGFTLEGTPSVDWSYAYTPDKKEETDIAVARVSFNMITEIDNNSNSSNLSGKESNNSFIVPQTIDIMLHGFSSGTPNIVAWTQAGNWQNLQDHMNAIIIPEDQVNNQQEENDNVLNNTPSSEEESSDMSSENDTPSAPSLEPKSTERSTTSNTPSSSSKEKKNVNKKNKKHSTKKSSKKTRQHKDD